jgi:hypothetical protein
MLPVPPQHVLEITRSNGVSLSCAAISDLLGEMIAVANEASHQFLSADALFLTVAVTGVIFLVEIGIFIVAGMI